MLCIATWSRHNVKVNLLVFFWRTHPRCRCSININIWKYGMLDGKFISSCIAYTGTYLNFPSQQLIQIALVPYIISLHESEAYGRFLWSVSLVISMHLNICSEGRKEHNNTHYIRYICITSDQLAYFQLCCCT